MSQEMSKFLLLKKQSLPWQMISNPKVLQPSATFGCDLSCALPHQGGLRPDRGASSAPDGLLPGRSGISLLSGSLTSYSDPPPAVL